MTAQWTKGRVLVVDDDTDTADALATFMRLEGHLVTQACNGSAALAVAQQFLPHVVFMDLSMPGIQGAEVASYFRQRASLHIQLIVAVSGSISDAILEDVASPFDALVIKPADLEALGRFVRDHLAAVNGVQRRFH